MYMYVIYYLLVEDRCLTYMRKSRALAMFMELKIIIIIENNNAYNIYIKLSFKPVLLFQLIQNRLRV